MRFRLPQCLTCHSAATSGEARHVQKSSQCLKLAFHTKSHTMRNSNCRGSAAEHGGTRWELCALRSSSAKKRLFFVDNTDGQVDTLKGKNLFHSTAMTVYQRQPTIDDRTYLTEAKHPESHLSSLSMAWLLCMNLVFTKCQGLSAFFIRAIYSKPSGYCAAYLLFDDYSTNSLKDHTRQQRTSGISSDPGNKVNNNTPTQI